MRLAQYARARSLWLDEAMLANNVIELPLTRLMPPHLIKVAPFGFLAAEKLVIGILGTSEIAFRLIPLLAALGSLVLLYVASRQLLDQRERLLALAIFALSPPLIYFASEAKPYSSDVFITLALTIAVLYYLRAPSGRLLVGLGAAGVIAVWFSYPAIFLLAVVGPIMLWIDRTQSRPLWPVLAVGASWVASFVGCYELTMRDFATQESLVSYWSSAFAPFPPLAWSDLAWYGDRFSDLFDELLGTAKSITGLALFLAVVGAVRMWKRRRVEALVVLGPLGATLIASMAQRYPVEGRVVLFWCPALVLCLAAGAGSLTSDTRLRWVTALLAAMLLLAPVESAFTLAKGRTINVEPAEEMGPLLQELVHRVKTGDAVYVYYGAQSAASYYARRLGWNHRLHLGKRHRDDPESLLLEIDRLRADRLWLIFSHVHHGTHGNEKRLILDHVKRRGRIIQRIQKPGAWAFCVAFE